MPFVWSIGTIIGPAVGGTLAQPAINYPSIFSDTIFAKFPYLLPNLVCSIMLLISILAGYLFLTETHPDMQPWSTPAELDNSAAETPLMATAGAMDNSGVDLRADSYGTFNEVTVQKEERWNVNADGSSRPISIVSVEKQKIFTKRVVMLVVALGIFTYHNMTYDHLLPIFLQDDRNGTEVLRSGMLSIPGGLGLRTQDVGVIMSFNGLIALLVQGVIFPIFAEWLGVWKLFLMVTILHPIAYFIVPFLAFLPQNLLYPGIYGCLTIRNFFAILGYPVILILLKEACPKASVLGTINGLAASAGAACRTVAPPVAGLLYSLGATQGFTGIAWWGSCLVAVIGTIQLYWVRRAKNGASVVRPVRTCMIPTECSRRESVVVHILVNDV
ncbi:hypothetical protein MMC14_001065 [Varicellaria rhodocarpa]|nr:hypothetical protein [Varicellaria rhodocarpa]